MSAIEKEKQTVSKMIRLYCRLQHKQRTTICADCSTLEVYAHERLARCSFGENKPVCKTCLVHCYKLEYREKIKTVMRFSGPRMLLFHPVDAVIYFFKTKKYK
ncbi:MAG: nitrous oxide-stimulated promoter family protein [Bacteroidales bacterium]|jgi:hypothetical protein|nr:nitrous oxide-stimulated promoter family protein [Bacteroidales bacterium]